MANYSFLRWNKTTWYFKNVSCERTENSRTPSKCYFLYRQSYTCGINTLLSMSTLKEFNWQTLFDKSWKLPGVMVNCLGEGVGWNYTNGGSRTSNLVPRVMFWKRGCRTSCTVPNLPIWLCIYGRKWRQCVPLYVSVSISSLRFLPNPATCYWRKVSPELLYNY